MNQKAGPGEKTGLYLGTEIDEKWWRRYTKDKMLARGNGKYWHDNDSFFFLRYLTKEPISIAKRNILEFKVGKWHAGKWGAGKPVLKIIWSRDGQRLSSGFLISKSEDEINGLISALTKDFQDT